MKGNYESNSIYSCAGPCPALTVLKSLALLLETFQHLIVQKVGSYSSQQQAVPLPYALLSAMSNISASWHHTTVKESLKIALRCYQVFKQQGQKLRSPTGSTCFPYCGVSANWQHCPSLNLLAKRQDILLDPRGCWNNSGIEQASLCSSKGLLWRSWCLCHLESLLKIFNSLTTCLHLI